MVSYQHGKGDQFYYRYGYDAENRVIKSYSSRDKLVWAEDAAYIYNLHGPLARTELGHYKVQGIDYTYTLQGCLKGINSDSLSQLYDISNDGKQGTAFERVSRDVYSFKIGYFGNDYSPIGGVGANAFTAKPYTAPGSFENTGNPLFNGNISYTTVALSKINFGATTGYSYSYDQLNRLVEMRQHGTNAAGGWSNSNIITGYSESISYDANGNILKYLRKGTASTPDMDSLNYKYNRDVNGHITNNKLNHVRDQVSSGNYSVDIDNQSGDNYDYDKIGNLRKDAAESIDTVRWTVYGKINRVVNTADSTQINYHYDPGGNRTSKLVVNSTNRNQTFYVRDAQGNVLAVYSRKNEEDLKWNEQHLYGSSRLGMWNWDTIVPANPPVVISSPIYDSLMPGSTRFQLANQLGNVMSIISDKKIGSDSTGVVNYYVSEVLLQNDYYPGGMDMPKRQYSGVIKYRYGFNGKEKDTEGPVQYDYGFRIYDSRLVRFKSVDPLFKTYPYYTPYQFCSNNPIIAVDVDGLESSNDKNPSQPSSTKPPALPVPPSTPNYDPNTVYEYPTIGNAYKSHSHAGTVNQVYSASGGDETLNSSGGAEVISTMNSNLQPVRPGSIIQNPASPSAITNLNNAFYSASETGSEKNWVNLLLGGFIKGTIPENIVFSENGTVSSYLKGTSVYDNILVQWYDAGAPVNDSRIYGYSYGALGQANDWMKLNDWAAPLNPIPLNMSNFVGSAMATVLANPDANTIKITITNITSLNSGDYGKEFWWHKGETPFLYRDANNSAQPYSNFSQTYQLKINYLETIRKLTVWDGSYRHM